MNKNIQDLIKKPIKDLYKDLDNSRKKLVELKFEIAQAKTKKNHEIGETRKNIARILTIIQEKQWEEFEKSQEKKDGK